MQNDNQEKSKSQSYFSNPNFKIEEDKRNDICEFGGLSLVHKHLMEMGCYNLANKYLNHIKQAKPYTDADHVLNLTYNFFAGNSTVVGVEQFQENEGWKRFLEVEKLPDPTTQGDYLARFNHSSILSFQHFQDQMRRREWDQIKVDIKKKRTKNVFGGVGVLDCDSSIFETNGNCKEGANFSYNNIWGFHPLFIHLRNLNELLYVGLREGQVHTSNGVLYALWDVIAFVKPYFSKLRLYVDSGFYSKDLVRFCEELGVTLIMKVKRYDWVYEKISKIFEKDWTRLHKPSVVGGKKKVVKRKKRRNVKRRVLMARQKEKNKKYTCEIGEEWAEFEYQPDGWVKPYRFVVKRKLKRPLGEQTQMFDFYEYHVVATDSGMPAHILLQSYNDRAGQENLIEDFKNGLRARRVPSDLFYANWAYLMIAAFAWNIKVWMSYIVFKDNSNCIEWKTFVSKWILIPVIVVKKSRYIALRTKRMIQEFKEAFTRIEKLQFT